MIIIPKHREVYGNTVEMNHFKMLRVILVVFLSKIAGRIQNYVTKNVKIIVPLKYLSNFWRTLEMPLINCEMNTYLTWSENCIIVTRDHGVWVAKFEINHAKLYVPVVTLSVQDNEKL